MVLSVHIRFDGRCREHAPAAVLVEVKAYVSDSRNGDTVIYTNASVVHGKQDARFFTMNCDGRIVIDFSGNFASTASSLTMETGCDKSSELAEVTRLYTSMHSELLD